MPEAIIKRLPADTQMSMWSDTDSRFCIQITMTIKTVEQAEALRTALDISIIPLVKIGDEMANKKRPDLRRDAVLGDFGLGETPHGHLWLVSTKART